MILRTTLIVALLALAIGWTLPDGPTVFLIGDSTMADKPLIGNPERGWGQMFPIFFNDGIKFENHARNGRSTKSFLREGRWDSVHSKLRPGDFVFIQFGHNDAKKEDSTRFADPDTDYRMNLLRIVRETKSKNANPVLITPVCRRRFDDDGKFFDVHGKYPSVVREIGIQENVPVIDLNRESFKLFSNLGKEETKRRFLWADSAVFSALPFGKKDDTHFTALGASEVALLVANEMRRIGIPIASYLKNQDSVQFVGTGKRVLLDCYFNNEWRQDSAGKKVRYHYVWHDTTNSGFSRLGEIIVCTGATIDSIGQSPTAGNLTKRSDIYIIVDPDTPKETENPNVISEAAADEISAWVNAGGVLVLLGNDKGNSEFSHFNSLAERFGIHYNEDCRNKVVGSQFETATFDRFPKHKLFQGVRKIYIKELSTLHIQSPAEAVLTDGQDIIMAYAKVGKGSVFALGDPWLYNEYMGTWRLPEGYDNSLAADNLFRWLLQDVRH
jgi:lysophospholipase L1-like esterase